MDSEIKFGTDGWRGIIAENFTFQNVKIATRAIGNYILNHFDKSHPVVIGFDPRFLAERFAQIAASELIKLGLKVQISDNIVPTPVLAFYAAKTKTNGAMQFTASHNPPKYCGLKYITNYGSPAPQEVTDEITKYITAPQDLRTSGPQDLETFNPKEKYIKHLKTLIDFNKIKNANLKAIYDPMYGAGNNYLDFILKEAGVNTITIHNKRDPLFGNLLPEPKEEFLSELKEKVKENNAQVGFATDGDADRLGIVDENGIFYSPNKIASMLLRHLYKNKKLKGAVVRTLSTTHLLDHLANKYGLEVIETKVGFKWIGKVMMERNVLIGAEESGGISISHHIPDKDAVLSGMLVAEMLAFENKPIAKIYNDTLADANWQCLNDRFDLHVNDEQKTKLISVLQKKEINNFDGLKLKSVNTSEGAKYIFEDDNWFLARASGTEPMARVYFEATSEENLSKMKNIVKKILNN